MSFCPSSEFSADFVQAMRDRMAVSYAKYGPLADAFPHKVNAIEDLRRRLDEYLSTGNTEWLVDVANYAMIEFMHPSHHKAHFRATDSHESPGRFSIDEGFTDKPNRELTDDGWKSRDENLLS